MFLETENISAIKKAQVGSNEVIEILHMKYGKSSVQKSKIIPFQEY